MSSDGHIDDHEDYDLNHQQPHNLSRLSICTNSTVCDDDDDGDDGDDDDVDYGMARCMSGLSIENLEKDVEELSDCEKESSSTNGRAVIGAVKDYGSDKEKGKGGVLTRQETWRRKCRRMRKDEDDHVFEVVGRRSMDFDEMKGCRDLGFDLDLDNNNNTPSRLSVSFETSSGATSPISNWRISSPGDDPRDVKARLKMWAHAVAASSSTSNYSPATATSTSLPY